VFASERGVFLGSERGEFSGYAVVFPGAGSRLV